MDSILADISLLENGQMILTPVGVLGDADAIDDIPFGDGSLEMYEVTAGDIITFESDIFDVLVTDDIEIQLDYGDSVEVECVDDTAFGIMVGFWYKGHSVYMDISEMDYSIEPRMVNDPSRYDKTLWDLL